MGGWGVGEYVSERERERRFLSLLLGEEPSFFSDIIFLPFFGVKILILLSYFSKNSDSVGDLFWFCFKHRNLAP